MTFWVPPQGRHKNCIICSGDDDGCVHVLESNGFFHLNHVTCWLLRL